MNFIRLSGVIIYCCFLTACGGGSGGGNTPPAEEPNVDDSDTPLSDDNTPAAFQQLYHQGVDRYLGIFSPMLSEPDGQGGLVHEFGGDEGPLCYTGNPFSMTTRDGTTDELMIFLQGGGACGPANCGALDAGLPLVNLGILSASDPTNPASTYNLGYLPYCDGTYFTGDNDVDSDGDGINDRFFRGLQNLSASLDVIRNSYPNPSKIVLAGNSAGGYAVHYALPLVRKLYPEVTIDLINDSGVGIAPAGAIASLNDYWNSAAFYPADCDTCIGDDGNLTEYYSFQLSADGLLRMGFISSTRDATIVGQTGVDGAQFEAELTAAMNELELTHPDRFRSLIPDNDEHTFLIREFDFPVANTSVRQWVNEMLSGSEGWVSAAE